MSTADTDADADEVTASPPADTTRPERPGASRATFRLVAIAAAVFAVLCVVLAVLYVAGGPSKNGESADRTTISTTAARVAEAITAVDGTGGGPSAATVQQLGTAPVVSQYNEIADAIRKVMASLKLTSIRGTVKEVYVGDIDNGEAQVIIRLDLVYVGDNTRVIPDQYLEMSLAKLDGQWKVDNVQVLNVALSSTPTSTPSSPTSTSTPASTSTASSSSTG